MAANGVVAGTPASRRVGQHTFKTPMASGAPTPGSLRSAATSGTTTERALQTIFREVVGDAADGSSRLGRDVFGRLLTKRTVCTEAQVDEFLALSYDKVVTQDSGLDLAEFVEALTQVANRLYPEESDVAGAAFSHLMFEHIMDKQPPVRVVNSFKLGVQHTGSGLAPGSALQSRTGQSTVGRFSVTHTTETHVAKGYQGLLRTATPARAEPAVAEPPSVVAAPETDAAAAAAEVQASAAAVAAAAAAAAAKAGADVTTTTATASSTTSGAPTKSRGCCRRLLAALLTLLALLLLLVGVALLTTAWRRVGSQGVSAVVDESWWIVKAWAEELALTPQTCTSCRPVPF